MYEKEQCGNLPKDAMESILQVCVFVCVFHSYPEMESQLEKKRQEINTLQAQNCKGEKRMCTTIFIHACVCVYVFCKMFKYKVYTVYMFLIFRGRN